MIIVNGEKIENNFATLGEYLRFANYNPLSVAVEINEEIVPKSEYENIALKDGDKIEIVKFVGGG